MIQSPAAGDTLSGSVHVVASVATSLDAAGSYLMVDGQQIGTVRLTSAPFSYPLDANMLAAGAHTLQIWAHSTNNEVLLSNAVDVTVAAGATPVAPTPVTTIPVTTVPTMTPPVVTPAQPVIASTKAVVITYPASGQAVPAALSVAANISAALDAAGSYLMVDGQQYGYQRVGSAPYLYTLDPATLTTGAHNLQIWAHSTNNETLISDPVSITVVR